jgi:hypothetical protein
VVGFRKRIFQKIIQDYEGTIYAEANWSQPVQMTLGGKNTAVITGTSEYGDQVLFLIAQLQGESSRFETQYREIAESLLYQM